MRFAYLPLPTRQPVYALGGVRIRYRPIVPVQIISPQVLPPFDACLDCASDDTVFPLRLARRLGIDLSNAPAGQVQPVAQAVLPVKYARVTLLLADGFESCQWEAIVAFADVPLRWALLCRTLRFQDNM
ncbi:MAG TPA: hypothetical protein VGY66_18295 [Gemmataceae bacterium]|nr:hypothetical protein [Gemmataceae bacterium]